MDKARRRPPAAWVALHSGDILNTKVPRHRIDTYLETMRKDGYRVELEETRVGYRLWCTRSPMDRPKRPQLRVVK